MGPIEWLCVVAAGLLVLLLVAGVINSLILSDVLHLRRLQKVRPKLREVLSELGLAFENSVFDDTLGTASGQYAGHSVKIAFADRIISVDAPVLKGLRIAGWVFLPISGLALLWFFGKLVVLQRHRKQLCLAQLRARRSENE